VLWHFLAKRRNYLPVTRDLRCSQPKVVAERVSPCFGCNKVYQKNMTDMLHTATVVTYANGKPIRLDI
jgi:hypothetical protein